MNIDLIISANDIRKEKIIGKNVLIIDMLRATSVIVTALDNGCKEVIPVVSVEEAREIYKKSPNKYVLGGERNAVKIDGFDFSNSPLEYRNDFGKDKKLIMTTSNGTKAIKNSESGGKIFIGSVLNAMASAKKLSNFDEDIVIINSGTNGEFSMDDFICSGYIIDCILKFNNHVEITDIAKTALYVYRMNTDIKSFLKNAKHFKRLKKLGLEDDIEYCCRKDIIDIVPEYIQGHIII